MSATPTGGISSIPSLEDPLRVDSGDRNHQDHSGFFEQLLLQKMGQKAVAAIRRFEVTIQDYFKNPIPVSLQPAPSSPNRPEAPKGSGSSHPRLTDEIKQAIHAAGEKYQVPPGFLKSIIHAESAFNPKARSPAGAMGLMQLMPGTAQELGVKNPFDIHENIEGGARYFREMLDRFRGDLKLALAAYNAGPGAVERYGGIPPYAETKGYVERVLKYYSHETA